MAQATDRDHAQDRSVGDSPPPDVGVVIVTYNSAGVVATLLDSLRPALDGLQAEVVVVDNGSTDGTAEQLRRRSDCRLIEQTNLGYSAGINAGRRVVQETAPATLILNPDIILDPGSIARLLEALHRPDVGIVAPLVLNEDGSVFRSLRREPTIRRSIGLNFTGVPMLSEYVGRTAEYRTAHKVDWALGAALAVSRSCAAAVGDWDELLPLFGRD